MRNPFFRFKQFTVYHDKCAMKVGTDGVLLGAWVHGEDATRILDVGTGTGLIAMMIAQRFPSAKVKGLDIDEAAIEQANGNFGLSPFAERMEATLFDFNSFAHVSTVRYDLIVSNPPYFSDSLLPQERARTLARHAVSLTLDDLFSAARACLSDRGRLALIVPYEKSAELDSLCEKHCFYLHRKVWVYPLPGAAPRRLLLEVGLVPRELPQVSSMVIETSRHVYSPEFVDLVKDFYLYL